MGCAMVSRAYYFFFFSSRRRHTRFKCDWSSDVCSSDLVHRVHLKISIGGWVMGSSVYSMDEALHESARNPTRATTVGSHPSKNEGRGIIIPSLLRSANMSPLKGPPCLHPPLATTPSTNTGPPPL